MEENIHPAFHLEDLHPVASPEYGFEAICDSAHEDRVLLGVHFARVRNMAGETYEVFLQTTLGDSYAILTACEGKPGVVLWLPSGGSNLNGPAGGIFADMAIELQAAGVTSLRMGYRDTSDFNGCVLDTLGWLCFLKAVGAKEVVLVGHNVGVAVALATAGLHPLVKAVAAIAPREEAIEVVDLAGPKPLLIVHGEQDTRVPVKTAQDLYDEASEPKELVIYPQGGFNLVECRDELHQRLGEWLSGQLTGGETYLENLRADGQQYPDLTRSIPTGENRPPRQIVLTRHDIVDLDVDALVSPTGTWLDLYNTPLATAVVERGGTEIQDQLWAQAPVFVGDVAVTGAGRLKAKHVFHAITGGDSAEEPLTREEAVAVTTRGSLHQARELGLKTIALPAIGAGARGVAIEKAAELMVVIIAAHLAEETTLERVTLSVVSDGAYRAFEGQLKRLPE